MMMPFSPTFKARAVQRMVGPRALSANKLAQELGVSQGSLSRWLRDARSVGGMTKSSRASTPPEPPRPAGRPVTGADKLRVIRAAHGLDEGELGALLRREGVHETELQAWCAAAESSLGTPSRPASREAAREARQQAQRIQQLERELRRKDQALAEAAALLVLQKKVRALWGDGADPTDEPPAR
jgi:transposase-like protein